MNNELDNAFLSGLISGVKKANIDKIEIEKKDHNNDNDDINIEELLKIWQNQQLN